jgi:YegS/Rv2252/BmrU family lipid kinase
VVSSAITLILARLNESFTGNPGRSKNPNSVKIKLMPRAWLIYNPNAGRFPFQELSERAAQVLRSHGWEVRLEQTQSAEHVTALARQAAEQGLEALFTVGGDGTINLAARGLAGSQTALGVLPGGTANVFAKELGLPSLTLGNWTALEESAQSLANAPRRAMDLGLCGGVPFVLWAGIGFDAFAIHRIEPRPRWEKYFATATYAAALLRHAADWHGVNLTVNADGQQVSGHYVVAVMSNIHLYAGGMAQISPNACLDDGVLDLWLFEGGEFNDTLQRIWDLLAGRHADSDMVHCIPFSTLTLESDAPLDVQVDAEPVPYDACSITIEVQPRHCGC